MNTRYYLSWHPSTGIVCTRCFSSDAERAEFYHRIKDIPHAEPQQWEA